MRSQINCSTSSRMKRSVSNKSRSEAHPVAMRRVRICSWRAEKASSARKVSCRAIDSRTRLPSCSGEPGSAVAASQSTRVGFALMLARSVPRKTCVHRIRGPSEAHCRSWFNRVQPAKLHRYTLNWRTSGYDRPELPNFERNSLWVGTAMSVSTRPFGALGMPSRYPRKSECPTPDPSDFAPGLNSSYLYQAARSTSRRSDDRPSRAGKTRNTQEIQLVVARSRRLQPGWGGRLGVPRLLARQDELADRRGGVFIPRFAWRWAPTA